jgi:hypothetical protein
VLLAFCCQYEEKSDRLLVGDPCWQEETEERYSEESSVDTETLSRAGVGSNAEPSETGFCGEFSFSFFLAGRLNSCAGISAMIDGNNSRLEGLDVTVELSRNDNRHY